MKDSSKRTDVAAASRLEHMVRAVQWFNASGTGCIIAHDQVEIFKFMGEEYAYTCSGAFAFAICKLRRHSQAVRVDKRFDSELEFA